MELAEILRQGRVSEFNTTRSPRSRPDLFAEELAGLSLVGVDLSSANVDKADLTETDLTDANLMSAHMNDIDGTGAKFNHAIAHRIKLRGAWIEQADITGADFTRGDLSGAVMKSTTGSQVRLVSARLKEVDATGASWPEADMSEAWFAKADFTGADLSRVDLTEASGKEAILTNARLDGAIGSTVKLGGAQMQNASLMGVRFDGANLAGADLTGANLVAADLSRANLTGAVLTNAVLTGCSLAEACLDDADFTGADLADVDMTGIDPTALGLTEEQIASLSAHGAGAIADAPIFVADPAGAVAPDGKSAVAVWDNLDGDERSSVRWAWFGPRKKKKTGVLPMAGASILARAVVAHDNGTFEIVLIHDRPNGVAVVRYGVDAGELQPPKTSSLGYGPGVVPVVQSHDNSVRMWGLARRGPTLIIHRETDEGFLGANSERLPTARGFLGRLSPVMACKGGVVLPIGPRGAKKPLRTPEGFPGKIATAVISEEDERVLCAWVVEKKGRVPGGLRVAWIGGRGAPEVQPLTPDPSVWCLEGVATPEGIWLCWAADPGVVFVCSPGGDITPLELAVPIERVRFAEGGRGLLITTLDQGLVICDRKGKVLGELP